jgi:hypothetical protein
VLLRLNSGDFFLLLLVREKRDRKKRDPPQQTKTKTKIDLEVRDFFLLLFVLALGARYTLLRAYGALSS